MLRHFGFLVNEDWLVKQGTASCRGRTPKDRVRAITDPAFELIEKAGVQNEGNIRRVVTKQGNDYWCIALASTDPREGMYTPDKIPSQEQTDRLRAVLRKKDNIKPK